MAETKEILGENSYTQWVNKRLEVWWIPMINPIYLTENEIFFLTQSSSPHIFLKHPKQRFSFVICASIRIVQ